MLIYTYFFFNKFFYKIKIFEKDFLNTKNILENIQKENIFSNLVVRSWHSPPPRPTRPRKYLYIKKIYNIYVSL